MPASVIGSEVFGDLFGTAEIREIFSDRSLIQRYMDVEAAIASAQGRLGIIPQEAADEIVKKAQVENVDFQKLKARTAVVGFPIVGFVEQLVAACDNGLGEYAHWGVTTQDVVDTGDILQIRDAIAVIERDLDAVAELLAEMAKTHRNSVMAGRTHIQHAAPVTFGYKAAVWLSSIDRHRARLQEAKKRLLVGEFAGAVGSLASLGKRGLELQDEVMKDLDLGSPDITWHTARDNMAEITGLLAMICGSLGKIGTDIVLMAITEVAELREGFVSGRGSSSTMPQKRNPVVSEMLIVAAKNTRQLHGIMLDAQIHDHERGGIAPWQTEWYALPDIFIMTAAALGQAKELLGGLDIDVDRLRGNLDATNGFIVSENAMMVLGEKMGRLRAHDVVYDCCQAALKEGKGLAEALKDNEEIRAAATAEEIDAMVDPANYVGTAPEMVDRLLERRQK